MKILACKSSLIGAKCSNNLNIIVGICLIRFFVHSVSSWSITKAVIRSLGFDRCSSSSGKFWGFYIKGGGRLFFFSIAGDGYRCCIGRSRNEFPPRNLTALTTPSCPWITLSTTLIFHDSFVRSLLSPLLLL